jgi:hypothetical protein
LHTIDGPLANDTIALTYDTLGRSKTRSINGSANTTTVDSYDALGRVTVKFQIVIERDFQIHIVLFLADFHAVVVF